MIDLNRRAPWQRNAAMLLLSLLLATTSAGLTLAQDTTPTAEYTHPDWLVSADTLEEVLIDFDPDADAGDFPVLIGVWDRDELPEAVIPGTNQVTWDYFALAETDGDAVEEWTVRAAARLFSFGQLAEEDGGDDTGFSPEATAVLYDDNTLAAAGIWWVLDYLGHERKAILNGGNAAWDAETDVFDEALPVPPAGGPILPENIDLPPGAPHQEVLATLPEVQAALDDPNVVLIDTRSPTEYVLGHLPGAINIPYTENVTLVGDIPLWRDAGELRDLYADAGVQPDQTIITYGDLGVGAQVTYFTLRLLSYDDVAVYPAGWIEWSQYPDLPRE